MTVRLITTVQHFIGDAADVKPTGVEPGSTFWARDTDVTYVCYDGTNWAVGTALASPRLLYTPDLVHVRKTLTFTGAANLGQAASPITLFDITGRVKVERLSIWCSDAGVSAGAGTLAIGTADTVDRFLAATLATDMDVSKFVVAAVPGVASAVDGLTVASAGTGVDISTDIIGTVAVGDITGGTIIVDVWYRAISDDGALAGD